jgi:hypothetical protein
MSRTKLVLASVAVLALVSVLAGTFLLSGDGGTEAKASTRVVQAQEQPAEDPTAELGEKTAADPKPSGPSEIMPYATELSGETFGAEAEVPAAKRQKAPASAGDSCDHNYGRVPVCVPWDFPVEIKTPQEKCAYLESHGLKTVPVTGKDRQGLDTDSNGIACDQ